MTKKTKTEIEKSAPTTRRNPERAKRHEDVARAPNVETSSPSESTNEEKPFTPTDDSVFKDFMTQQDLAIAWIKESVPKLAERLELSKLEVEKGEYYDDAVRKRIADVVYRIPFRDAPGFTELFVILEHKGQSSKAINRIAIAQTLVYLGAQCLDAARDAKAKDTIPQPIPIIVYTGSNRNLKTIRWRDAFPLPPGLEEFALDFQPVFFNMTQLRHEGKLPTEPFLKVLYNTLTRHSVHDLDGFEETGFRPLSELPDKWSPLIQKRMNSLLVLYSTRIKGLPEEVRRERIETLCRSVNLEEKMGKDVLYEYFAPKAEQWGVEKGIGIGIEKGIGIGREEGIGIGKEKKTQEILTSQRQTLRATIQERFGACPAALKNALAKICDLDALINLRVFASAEAKSIDELLERVKAAVH